MPKESASDSVKQQQPGFIDTLWNFFSSIKLTVVLLIVIALFSMVGTFIQQNSDPEVYIRLYGEAGYKLIRVLQLDNLYSAWYFQLLLALFMMNLIVCSLERFPSLWRSLKRLTLLANPDHIMKQPFSAKLQLAGKTNAASKLERVLMQSGYKVVRLNSSEGVFMASEKGRISRFGPYITHFGIVITIIGAMIGGVRGVRGYVEIPEGQLVNYFYESGTHRKIALPFYVKCEDFKIVYYDQKKGRMPKDYFSKLAVYENDELIMRKTIEVNDPLKYKGFTFYQANYRPRTYTVDIEFQIDYEGSSPRKLTVTYGEEFFLKKGIKARVVDFSENLNNMGPVAILEISPDGNGKSKRVPVFAHAGIFKHVKVKGIKDISITDFHVKILTYATGLQVKKDPGVPVVLVGFCIISLGVMFSLGIFHKRIWAIVRPGGDGWEVCLGGWTYKNRGGFERHFQEIVSRLQQE